MENVLTCVRNRHEFRTWLQSHHDTERECWLELKRGRPLDDIHFYYLDAVEEALCFGWIDSTCIVDHGIPLQRFTPRKKNSPWSELNKERVRRLEKLGLMTDAGRGEIPPMGPRSFRPDPEIVAELKQARVWTRFRNFPPLYQRVRLYNIAFQKKHNPSSYQTSLDHLIEETRNGRMYGQWNDYGRLIEY